MYRNNDQQVLSISTHCDGKFVNALLLKQDMNDQITCIK